MRGNIPVLIHQSKREFGCKNLRMHGPMTRGYYHCWKIRLNLGYRMQKWLFGTISALKWNQVTEENKGGPICRHV